MQRAVSFLLVLNGLSLHYNSIRADVPEGTPCATPDQQIGPCLNIYSCEPLLNLLKSRSSDPEIRSYLQRSVCGYTYSSNSPMVCCPQSAVKGSDKGKHQDDSQPKERPSVSLLTPPHCGYSNETNTRVVGGNPAKLDQFPWMVALGYKNVKNRNGPKWLCGGSLITYRNVLTAGHCVYQRSDLYVARVRELDLYNDNDGATPEDIPIANVKLHENYNSVQHVNDIAIITLARRPSSDRVWPICLPHQEPFRSDLFEKKLPHVAGWGALYFRGPTSSTLQEAQIPVVPNQKCKDMFKNQTVIDERIICAGWINGEKDACQGDSGGPLMYGIPEDTSNRYYQIGIVSYGFKCAERNWPGVYTRVTHYIDWISNNIS